MPVIRAKVNALRPVTEIDPFYYDFKTALLNEVATILRSTDDVTVKNQFEEHLFLLYTKDFLAQLRSELAPAIAIRKFEGSTYGDFAAVKGKYDFNLRKFRAIVSGDLRYFFERKYQGPFVQQANKIIDAAYTSPTLAGFDYDFDTWWTAATSSINTLKEVEDFSSDLVSKKASEELFVANANLTTNVIVYNVKRKATFGS